MSYLNDFLFSPERANSPVRTLSGGERNRVLLARLFALPANVLVLDEPTNDLDIDTLELLEELLQRYAGTVFLVSHDRRFLDNVVTSTIAWEGDDSPGMWREYEGGYEDWKTQRDRARALREQAARSAARTSAAPPARSAAAGAPAKPAAAPAAKPRKLSYKEQRELDALPPRIEALEAEQKQLAEQLAGPSCTSRNPGAPPRHRRAAPRSTTNCCRRWSAGKPSAVSRVTPAAAHIAARQATTALRPRHGKARLAARAGSRLVAPSRPPPRCQRQARASPARQATACRSARAGYRAPGRCSAARALTSARQKRASWVVAKLIRISVVGRCAAWNSAPGAISQSSRSATGEALGVDADVDPAEQPARRRREAAAVGLGELRRCARAPRRACAITRSAWRRSSPLLEAVRQRLLGEPRRRQRASAAWCRRGGRPAPAGAAMKPTRQFGARIFEKPET